MATYLGHQEDSSGNILLPTPHSMATQIEFGTTASQAYAKGAYVVFNNRLCKASTAIASGDTLAIGTNLVQCSIGSELNSHLQAPNGDEFYFDYKDGKPGFYPSASKVASEFVPFGGTAEITVVSPSVTAGNSYTISYSGLKVGSRIALYYQLTGSDLNRNQPTVAGATVLYTDWSDFTNHIRMILLVNSSNVTISGTKYNTSGWIGASWQIS